MKNKYLLGVFIIFIIFVGIYVFLELSQGNDNSTPSLAMSVNFKDVEDLTQNSDVVIKGVISSEYEEKMRNMENWKIQEKIYKVEVLDLLYNQTDVSIDVGNTIDLAFSNTIIIGENHFKIHDTSIEMLAEGEYLLFLNKYVDETGLVFLPVSPLYIYKLDGNSYKNLSYSRDKLKQNDLSKIKKIETK